MAKIDLKDVTVVGIDVNKRAQGIRQLFLTKRKLVGRANDIPILKEVSLHIQNGERVGVVGSNGSGKSSLLKVIAGIYPPSSGLVEVNGSIMPIIEMGLGFEPEFSGRENIRIGLLYNSSVTEYSKELEKEVVSLSGLGAKIDQPFKSFSSGMKARLAFAVGVFNSPDILLLDEIFAPGDEEFISTSKSIMLNKFQKASISILVSHDTTLIQDLCDRCLFFEGGRLIADGEPASVCAKYLRTGGV